MSRAALLLSLCCATVFEASAQPQLTIETDSNLPDGGVGSLYSQVLVARNGQPPYFWSLAGGSLPDGLNLAASGVISGTLNAAGNFDFTVRVNDSGSQSVTKAFRISVSPPGLSITTGALAPGTVGQAYSAALTAGGGTPPYSWSLAGGSLPGGLNLAASGVISGTLNAAGNFDFTVRVNDSGNQSVTKAFRISVSPPGLSITTGALASGTVGQAYSAALTAGGGTPPYSWSLAGGSLPGGLNLAASGVISGTLNAAGNFDFTVRVNDSGSQSVTKAFRISVSPPGLSITTGALAPGAVGQAYSAALTAGGGTPPYSWSLAAGSLPGGLNLAASGALSGTPSAAGDFDFTVRVNDSGSQSVTKVLRISVSPPTLSITTGGLGQGTVGQAYSAALQAAGGTPPYSWSLAAGSLPGGLTLASSGAITGTTSAAGEFDFTVRVNDSGSQSATKALRISVSPPGLSITTGALAPGTVGQAYSAALTAGGGTPPYSWSLAGGSLPSGLNLASSGAITGTTSAAGEFDFTVRVNDSGSQSATKALRISVSPPGLSITTGALAPGTVGQVYSAALTAGGGTPPYSWSLAGGSLPGGLTLASSGAITGTTSAAGEFDFTVRVNDSGSQSVTKALRISVSPPTLSITTGTLGQGTVSQAYSAALTAGGGTPPYSWSLAGGSLPGGLTLASSGAITGTTSAAGEFDFTVRVNDSGSQSVTKALRISVSRPGLSITTGGLGQGTVGQAYSAALEAAGGTRPYSWSLAGGSLPGGLSLAASGIITGATSAPGEFDFTVRVNDSGSQSATKALRISVSPSTLSITTGTLAAGSVGQAYSTALAAGGGTPPYSWSLAGGSLPGGLTLAASGAISGTPNAAGDFDFTVRVNDSGSQSATKALRIAVTPPGLSITTGGLGQGTVGQAYSAALEAAGGTPPYAWSLAGGNLPGGLSLAASGIITGATSAAGEFDFTVRVNDSRSQSATKALRIAVSPSTLSITTGALAPGSAGQAYSTALTAGGGTPPYSWSLAGGTLPGGLNLTASGAISGTPNSAGDFDFTVRVNDSGSQSVTKALRISVSGPGLSITTGALAPGSVGQAYSTALTAGGGTPPYSWSLAGGTLPGGLNLAASGAISGTPNAAGDFDFTVRVNDSGSQSVTKALRISVSGPGLSITTGALAPGSVGQAYSTALTAGGGTPPYSWSLAGGNLPGGLNLAASGAISGTPNAAGDFDFTVRVSDSGSQAVTKALRISVSGPGLSITTGALAPGSVGQAYSTALTAGGGTPPYSWSLAGGTLPGGLNLAASGAIGGTPNARGNFDFTVRVNDSGGQSVIKALRISVSPAATTPLTITTVTLAEAATGQTYLQMLSASGGTSPYSWSVAGGALPAGISLAGSGVLAGTATVAGAFDFTARVTDSAGASANKALRLSVVTALAPFAITTAALPAGMTAVEYVHIFAASGGRPPYRWSVLGGAAPAGLSLEAASGRLSGIPAAAGSFPVTTRVMDADGRTADRVFTLVIGSALAVSVCPAGTGRTGVPYTGAFASTGGVAPLIWSISSGQLPPGVALNAQAGTLSGAPAAAGQYQFSVAVADAAGATATRSCTISIDANLEILTDTLPDGTTRAIYSHTLRARGGNTPFRWTISSGTLAAGLSLDPNTGTIAGQPTQPGRFSFIAQLADGTGRQVQRMLSLTVSAGLAIPSCPTTATTIGLIYSSAMVAIGGVTPYTWAVESGSLPQGLSLTADTGLVSGRASQGGDSRFSVRATDATGATVVRECTIAVAPEFRLITSAVSAARMRAPYTAALRAEGGRTPYIWTMTAGALPPGLTLNSALGEVSGIPAVAGTFRFTVRVTDAIGLEIDRAFELVVAAGLSISACPTPVAIAEEAYSSGLSITGGQQPVTWALESGVLPEGLTLSAEAGTITGMPAAAGTSDFVIRATDAAADTATRMCSVAVSPGALRLSGPDTLSDAVIGSSYQATLSATGGRLPYIWSLAEGALPSGLSLDSNGTLSGTPEETGLYRFTLRVADQDRGLATRTFELRVLAGKPPVISFSGLPEILGPAEQPRVHLSLENAYPAALHGELTLRFRPDPGLIDDPSIRFVTGGRTVSFEIAPNSTDCMFPVPELALQTGSVAGTIELSVRLFAGDIELTNSSFPVHTVRVDRTAPVISSVRINQISGGFELIVAGISTTRDVTSATFQFTPASGSRLDSMEATVPTGEAARRWFQDARSAEFGGQFSFVQPFAVQGASLSEVTVTLTNGQGTSQPVRARF